MSSGDVRLVCLPHAGGSASFYHPFSRLLPSAVEMLAIQYPGRQDRRLEPCIVDLRELADRVLEELRPYIGQPLALFGHSMGATLAFEVARRLEEQDTPPTHLFVSGRRAPSRSRHEDVHLRDDAGLIAELAELSGTDTRLLEDEEMRRMVLPALRGDYTAAETYVYQPGPPLACPVTMITGDADPRVDRDEAEAWEKHTTGPFELLTFPGGHFYLSDQRAEVAQAVAARLLPGLPTDH
ncbi:alpha/beta fold hydrolase [Streptomyces sp. LX-29]|uniref:thioesterase II family protein n=1 Tax=Streptomyces sp. LX-29 TaxID=2900152 RepID=UPI00240DBB6E|nr:alpha/beta fold hydrolase [Streptomyces sp. LX-29]WFB10962.1 alpha/beta fold hydrolase [Streptomyces sp. LX-29]